MVCSFNGIDFTSFDVADPSAWQMLNGAKLITVLTIIEIQLWTADAAWQALYDNIAPTKHIPCKKNNSFLTQNVFFTRHLLNYKLRFKLHQAVPRARTKEGAIFFNNFFAKSRRCRPPPSTDFNFFVLVGKRVFIRRTTSTKETTINNSFIFHFRTLNRNSELAP